MKTAANPAGLREIEELIGTLDQVDAEIRGLELVGLPLEDRLSTVTRELDECEEVFVTFGFSPAVGDPRHTAHLQRQALIGAISVAGGRNQLVGAGEQRIRRQMAARGDPGMTVIEKDGKLFELRQLRRRTSAQIEGFARALEANGIVVSRDRPDPEMYLVDDTSLQLIASGGEHTR